MGLGYAEDDTVMLDPNAQIQHTLPGFLAKAFVHIYMWTVT